MRLSLRFTRIGRAVLVSGVLLVGAVGPAQARPLDNNTCPDGSPIPASGICPSTTTAATSPAPVPPPGAGLTPQQQQQALASSQRLINAFYAVALYMSAGVIPPEVGFPFLLIYRRQANSLPEPYRSQTIGAMAAIFQ
jgi:hypothetical protein